MCLHHPSLKGSEKCKQKIYIIMRVAKLNAVYPKTLKYIIKL